MNIHLKTRYREIGPKVNYYFGVFVSALALLFCAFLCFKVDPELQDGGVRFAILSVFSLLVFLNSTNLPHDAFMASLICKATGLYTEIYFFARRYISRMFFWSRKGDFGVTAT